MERKQKRFRKVGFSNGELENRTRNQDGYSINDGRQKEKTEEKEKDSKNLKMIF